MGMSNLYLFICACSCIPSLYAIQNNESRPTVNTTKGEVQGWVKESKTMPGKFMRVFKGIPYAKSPERELRFLDPVPVDAWKGTLNLTEDEPSQCPQFQFLSVENYSENCLFINVFTPEGVNANSNLPVVVYVYGGAFTVGTSSSLLYGPNYLVSENIVYVTMNYRVGALGFLNLGTDEVPGNAGLKDQLLALQWVQTEIANFGGDPTRVTLFGESAGAVSVILHYLSPKSENLFTYAIADSGNPLAEWAFLESGFLERAASFATSLNCTRNDSVDLSCLQASKVEDIITYQNLNLSDSKDNALSMLPFVPSLEKSGYAAFLDDTPLNLLKTCLSSRKDKPPLLTGINKDEGIMQLNSVNADYYEQFYADLKYLIPLKYRTKRGDNEVEEAVSLMKQHYFDNRQLTLTNLKGYVNLFTDILFGLSTAQFARQISSVATVYLYQFEFLGLFNNQQPIAALLNVTGVAHGDELGYIFYRTNLNQTTVPDDNPSKKTLTRMLKMWTNFIKTGNPTPDGTTDDLLENVIWYPITERIYPYMIITEHLNMSTANFKEETLSLWDHIDGTSSSNMFSCSQMLICIVTLLIMYIV